jgi:hypothetical protein
MMNRLFLSVVVMLLASTLQAQQGFIQYTNVVGASKFSMHQLAQDRILIALANNSGFSILNNEGIIEQTVRFEVDTFLGIQAIKPTPDGALLAVGSYRKGDCTVSQSGRNHPAWFEVDSDGNILNSWYYELNAPNCSNYAGDGVLTANSSVIIWGFDRYFFALKAEQTGDVAWARRFSHTTNGSFRFIKELPNGDLLAGINMDAAGAAVGRMDAEGNFLWLKSYFRPKGMITDALIEDDGSFIITGFTDSLAAPGFLNPLPTDYWPKLFVMKLSGEGEVLWCKGYDISPYRWYTRPGTRIEQHHDGNYILLGNIGDLNYPFGYRPQLMKLDQNGDTLWTRSAGREGHVYDIINMTMCSDGGIMYNGQSLSNTPDMFIFKTDSLGYLPCHNQWHATTIVDLFPTDSSFTLTSIDGATAHPAFITEEENPPITLLEGCANSIPRPEKHPSGFRIRPNPNTGHFTLSFADPLMAESYYSVYDTMGKLLFQRPLPQGKATEEVDLTRFGAGNYVVRVTSKEGSCYERVVVE